MEGQVIIQFLSDYGYWIILPLMTLEGPIVTIIAAFMASMGVFDVVVVLIFSIIGDMLGDILLYGAGRVGGVKFVNRFGKYVGITERLVLKMEKFFEKHGGKTIFLVKMTTGLCWATWVAAGIVRMKFWRFVWYSFLGGVVWSSFLVIMGYFFGYLYEQIAEYIKYAGWIIFSVAVLFFAVVNLYKKSETKRLFKE